MELLYILGLIVYCVFIGQLFKKAGEPSWTSFVPIYSSIVMAKIAKKSAVLGLLAGIGWALYGLSLVSNVLEVTSLISIMFLIGFVAIIILTVSFAKKFGKNTRSSWPVLALVTFSLIGIFMIKDIDYKG